MSVYRPLPADREQAKIMREQMRKARELLQQPPPDTFLGRRTHEPFPQEDHDASPKHER